MLLGKRGGGGMYLQLCTIDYFIIALGKVGRISDGVKETVLIIDGLGEVESRDLRYFLEHVD